MVEAFAVGYAAHHAMSHGEIRAIPELIVVREAISLVHWAGRYDQGLISVDNLAGRFERLAQVHALVTSCAGELIHRVTRAMSELGRSIK